MNTIRTGTLTAGAITGLACGALVACDAGREPESASGPLPILLIVVDTLRADHLGLHGYTRPTSPRIDAWAAGGAVFERAQAASSWTLPSMASLLTGEPPSAHTAGVARDAAGEILRTESTTRFHVLPSSVETIAETLAARGYATAAFVTNPYLEAGFGTAQGFTRYESHDDARASVVVDRALEWFDRELEDPFFVLVHLIDPHLPYDAPPGFAQRFTRGAPSTRSLPIRGPSRIREAADELSDGDRAFIAAAYDEEIAYADAQIGRLLDGLAARGILERTLVVLTSDHGEELFEHGGFEHGHSMYQELLHVPLVMVGPGVVPCRIAATVSSLDVAATLLDAAGARPPHPIPARSLLESLLTGAEPSGSVAVSEDTLYGPDRRALVAWPQKLVEDGARSVFDLARDPEEEHPLDDEALAQRLAALLDARLAAARATAASAPPAELDPRTLEELRELGYADR